MNTQTIKRRRDYEHKIQLQYQIEIIIIDWYNAIIQDCDNDNGNNKLTNIKNNYNDSKK